jgi:adenine-specific DNA methylase
MNDAMPRVLIEDWLPIEALGAESKRERGASSALPPLYFLHVWWARRPLTVSRAAILAGMLPQWSSDWPPQLLARFPSQQAYRKWFLELNGIFGDPVQAGKLLLKAKQQGRSIPNPYTHARAFTVNPSVDDLGMMHELLEFTWGTTDLHLLDPFAGGGSIPFEALRYGFTTIANDLSPVAAVILRATLDYPIRFGPSLVDDIQHWATRWYELVRPRLQPFFTPLPPGAEGAAYLWARTIACPSTSKLVPLSPNWWLRKGSDPVAVQVLAEESMDAPRFVILEGSAVAAAKPDEGTISRGVARSPWTGETISSDYIKSEAQAGRLGQMLYAVSIKELGSGFRFRSPTEQDLAAVKRAEIELAKKRPEWIAKDVIPTEQFPRGNDNRPIIYGMPSWSDLFSPRQLLAMGTFSEALRELVVDARQELDDMRCSAVETYLGIMLDKAAMYNNRNCRFDPGRGTRSIFDRHDFAFVASHAEFDASANLAPWAIRQVLDAYQEIAELVESSQVSFITSPNALSIDKLQVYQGSATSLDQLPDGRIQNITVDPPYYDNVQYAELADFFYVWLKRSVGHLFPDFFADELTNKDDETVASPARFESMGRRKKKLAEQDYERKMAAAFREMYRVLHPHGVLTVMFTHKQVEAWDTLATALIGAGFVIKASWPVHTESEHSLHQAKRNAAASTILLVCRKRSPSDDGAVWWDDIQGRVRRVAREKAMEYAAQGISGVDLYISTFGPTLSVISENWPVLTSDIDEKTGQPRPLRPDTALDLAREEVIRLRKEGLLAGKSIEFDPVTDWTLMAWDAFQAEQFPYDEARKLAIALGLEVEDDLVRAKRLVTKKGQYVVLQEPAQRRRKGMVDPDAALFEHWIDALHTAMMVYDEDGAGACDVFLMNRGLKQDTTFKAGLQALINTIPRTKIKSKFARPEADVLDRMRLAFYADELTVPSEEEPPLPRAEQLGLFDAEIEEDSEDEDEG